jgi:hypothetical protein
MNKSLAMVLLGICVYEAVPFGWLFVMWATVSALPVLLFALVYFSLVEGLRFGGHLVLMGWSRLKSAFRDKDKE